MAQLTDTVFGDLMPVYATIFAVAFYFNWRFLNRIRKLHPKSWAGLGSPSIFNNSISSSLKFVGFLFRKKYELLEDLQLNFYGAGTRIGMFSIAGFLALFVILALIGLYQNGVWSQPVVVKGPDKSSVAIVGCIILYLLSFSLFLTRLKNRHRQKWEDLGEPSFFNQTLSNQSKTLGFFLGGGYLQLKDTVLILWAVVTWLLFLSLIYLVWIR